MKEVTIFFEEADIQRQREWLRSLESQPPEVLALIDLLDSMLVEAEDVE